jgi:hypothetical protein
VGRARKLGAVRHSKPGQPRGGAWEALRRRLWARWRAAGAVCFHCGCPDPDQIEHRIGTARRPDLAMEESNLVPSHGRCPHCGIACQAVAASNSAERDSLGRSVPFSPGYKQRKSAEAAERRGKTQSPGKSRPVVVPGREW